MNNGENIAGVDRDNKSSHAKLLFVCVTIALVFVAIGPLAFSSDWVSSSDFHACIEISSSFIAIMAAVACLIYYFGLKNRFFLIVGLGFFVCGSGDLVHGILGFRRLFADSGIDFSRFIPGTYVAGRITLAIMIIAAPIVEYLVKEAKNVKREAVIFSSIAVTIGGGLTALAFTINLPQFIYPHRLISRPVDFFSAILFMVAFGMIFRRFEHRRDVFCGWLLICILLNIGGQVYMSFSKQLFDIFFDMAHFANILSYCVPVTGIAIQSLQEMKKSRQAEDKLAKRSDYLGVKVEERTTDLLKSNETLQKEFTQRKKAEKELVNLSKQIEFILGATNTGIDIIDSKFNVRYIDPEWKKVYGEPAGRKCYEYFMGRDKICPGCGVVKALQTKNIVITEEVLVKENNRPIQITTKPYQNDKGEWLAAEVNVDISDRKRAEEGVRLAYHELEAAHNKMKGMQSQLVQNEKLASIGQLAAGVAHEMNTPVGFVASNFQTLESYIKKIRDMLVRYEAFIGQIDASENPELRNMADDIGRFRDDMKIDFILEDIGGLFDDSREGLERITSVIQNLRDFSRIDQPGSRDEYDINKGIESTLVVARNEIKYDAEVKTEFSELPMILCHSDQINQVFLNILINAAQAIKYQERDDKGTITIKTYASDGGVVCEISDDGPGIPPDKVSKVFDPFFTTKPAGKGTGLGLSVSYDIVVNKHNGKLLVDSTVGKGTKFTIKLPIGTKENDKEEIMSNGKEKNIVCGR